MRIADNSFIQRGTGKAYNEDAQLLDGQMHQGRVREQGEIDSSESRYFAVAVLAIHTLPLCQLLALMRY